MPNQRVLVSCLDESQEYQHRQAEEAVAAGQRVGLDVDVVYCQGDIEREAKQIREAVQAESGRRPVAVMVHPVAVAGLEGLARATLGAGVGWISLEPAFYLETMQREFPDKLVALVTTDNQEVGRLQARLIRALLPDGGNIVHVEGPSLNPAAMGRREGLKEGLAGSKVTIVKTVTGDWSENGAEKAMAMWLRWGGKALPPALVAAQNDMMAAGARKAVRELKPDWTDVLFTGCDGLPGGGIRQVQQRLLAGTVVQPFSAGAAVELVARFLKGEKVPVSTQLPAQTYPSIEELERRAGTP